MKTAAVANPRSASGKTGRRWPQIAAALAARLGPVETQFTEQPGHAIALTRDLLEQGYERIIAVGGDGTINEVTNGFLRDDQPVRPGACLGILPLGTGGDFRRTLGVPSDFREALEMLAAGVVGNHVPQFCPLTTVAPQRAMARLQQVDVHKPM
ncbi:MAG: acylglycerol kinase family protein [Acidobacteria bacterium]|nr:acylglycerol kinase family protein [Acidobacteriota bacterium]